MLEQSPPQRTSRKSGLPLRQWSRSSCWSGSDRCDREYAGSGPCPTEVGDFGYGYDGAYGLWKADGSQKGLQPEEQGKKSFQPILTFLAETRELEVERRTTEIVPAGCRSPSIWNT